MTRNEGVGRHGSAESSTSWRSIQSNDTVRPFGRGSLGSRGTPVTVQTNKPIAYNPYVIPPHNSASCLVADGTASIALRAPPSLTPSALSSPCGGVLELRLLVPHKAPPCAPPPGTSTHPPAHRPLRQSDLASADCMAARFRARWRRAWRVPAFPSPTPVSPPDRHCPERLS